MATTTPTDPLPPNENIGPTFVILTVILTVLIAITTSLRLYSRWALRNLGWDDYTIAITAVFVVARTAIQAVQVQHGNGRHQVYISRDDLVYINMLGYFVQLFLFVASCLLKVSICLLLLRIKDTRGLKILLGSVMAGVFVTNAGCAIILLAQCSPVETYWKGTGGVCWNPYIRTYAFYIAIAYNTLADLLCSFLPLAAVWKVRIPLQTKLFISGLISLGLLATGFGVVRASSLRYSANDMSWAYCLTSLWASLELGIGIIAANLALSRSIYKSVRHGKLSGSQMHLERTSRSAYIKRTSALRFEASVTETTSNSRLRSTSQSDGSVMVLEPRV